MIDQVTLNQLPLSMRIQHISIGVAAGCGLDLRFCNRMYIKNIKTLVDTGSSSLIDLSSA